MTRTLHLCLIALAATAALPIATADAGRVVVLAVQGDPEGEFEDALISIVEERHDLVTSGEFERAARKSGIDDLDGPAIGKIARKLGADAVVEGTMSREDEGFLLIVRIRGTDGKTAKKITVDLSKPRLSAKAKKHLGTGVYNGIDAVLGLADDSRIEDDEAEEDEDRPAKKKKAKKGKKDKEARSAKRDDDDEDDEEEDDEDEEASEDEDDEDDEDNDRVAARDDDDDDDDELSIRADGDASGEVVHRGRAALILEVGPSAKARTLGFTSRPDFEQAPTGYKSPLVPGVRVAGEAYPLAFKDKRSAAAGLGVGFEFDQTVKLISRSSDAPDIALPTLQRHWQVDGKFRYALGKKPVAPTVTLSMGYGRRAFIVDRSALPEDTRLDMPDVDYRFYAPGLAVRVPFGDRAAIHGAGKALLFKAAGAIQSMDSYGGAKITGFDAQAGIELRIAKQIVVDVTGSMTQIGFVFAGNGAETVNRDLDPSSVDVGGASDRYLGVVGSLGWSY